mmetsp:Transcript_4182/g.9002  ORF Transcript_4182/g.9002 Transcript_4182/m.9002 type:complete len:314 (-) Transcript_4182:1388-2329(-)
MYRRIPCIPLQRKQLPRSLGGCLLLPLVLDPVAFFPVGGVNSHLAFPATVSCTATVTATLGCGRFNVVGAVWVGTGLGSVVAWTAYFFKYRGTGTLSGVPPVRLRFQTSSAVFLAAFRAPLHPMPGLRSLAPLAIEQITQAADRKTTYLVMIDVATRWSHPKTRLRINHARLAAERSGITYTVQRRRTTNHAEGIDPSAGNLFSEPLLAPFFAMSFVVHATGTILAAPSRQNAVLAHGAATKGHLLALAAEYGLASRAGCRRIGRRLITEKKAPALCASLFPPSQAAGRTDRWRRTPIGTAGIGTGTGTGISS